MLRVADEECPAVGVDECHVGHGAVRENNGEVEIQVTGEGLEFSATELMGTAYLTGLVPRAWRGQGTPSAGPGAAGLKSARKLSRVTRDGTSSPSKSPAMRCLSNNLSYSVTSRVS